MESKIADVAGYAAKKGLGQFLLGIKAGPMVTIHFNEMSIKSAMEVIIAGFHQVVRMDLEKNPQYTEARKQIYLDLSTKFDALIRESNARFEKIPN